MPETSTTKLLSTIETTTKLLSTPLPKSVSLVHLILTLHKQLSTSLQALCQHVLSSLRESAQRGHDVIKATNTRICEIHEELSTIDERLSDLRARRAGLWEGVNYSLTKLASYSDSSWGLQRLYNRVFSRDASDVTTRAEKLRTREEFRDSAHDLKLADEQTRDLEKTVTKLGIERDCLQASVSEFRGRVTRFVKCIGFWERLWARICDVGVDDVLPLVEMFLDTGDVVDATAVIELPDGVCIALRRYCERWCFVLDGGYSQDEVLVGDVEDVLKDVEEQCDQLEALSCSHNKIQDGSLALL